eukprot:GEMP01124032.1.p1 GENE.GEMP01124032.1~~GEMP01124032.1.p1  ORF type:complete len:105 (+),score=5.40 GEMP01124032.1:45-359(+)
MPTSTILLYTAYYLLQPGDICFQFCFDDRRVFRRQNCPQHTTCANTGPSGHYTVDTSPECPTNVFLLLQPQKRQKQKEKHVSGKKKYTPNKTKNYPRKIPRTKT